MREQPRWQQLASSCRIRLCPSLSAPHAWPCAASRAHLARRHGQTPHQRSSGWRTTCAGRACAWEAVAHGFSGKAAIDRRRGQRPRGPPHGRCYGYSPGAPSAVRAGVAGALCSGRTLAFTAICRYFSFFIFGSGFPGALAAAVFVLRAEIPSSFSERPACWQGPPLLSNRSYAAAGLQTSRQNL